MKQRCRYNILFILFLGLNNGLIFAAKVPGEILTPPSAAREN
jgi:hypothetical protein